MTKMYDDGNTPYDLLINLSHLVDSLVKAHNDLADDHIRLVDQLTKTKRELSLAQARIEELRRNLK